MKVFCEVLEELYKKVLLGATLENDSHDYIFYLNPAVSDQDCSTATSLEWANTCGIQGRHQPISVGVAPIAVAPVCLKTNSQMSGSREVMLLQLTVIKVMTTRILSVKTEFHAKEQYRDVIKILLESAKVDSKLICMFQNSDKLLSHMAAQCLALLLYFQLREKITLSNSWIAFCQKNLSEYSESNKAIYCLWTLTAIIKEIFKDSCSQKTEILKQFLTHFDTIFEVFYNSLFSQHFENCRDTSKIVNILMCFLDLLELLIASRIHLKLHFTCQRILFLKPSCMLEVITWPIQAFVKRKVIIFLKKCLLCKVGEDLCRGSVPALMPPDHHVAVDMLALANAVLQAVNSGLLKTLSVYEKHSFFGGDEVQPECELITSPDHVILRAASLVIMKSLEIKFQNYSSASEVKEQDDDMLEAAKASLGIYLTLTRGCEATESLTQGKEMWDHHTHENGYNPHCIFLFFLKNIGFDSTVLLDFLISSETCFLEYFVRYLKLLQKDWDNFFTICNNFDATESKYDISICGCVPSLVQDQSSNQTIPHRLTAPHSHRDVCARHSWASDAPSEPLKAVMSKGAHTMCASSLSSPRASQSLVDYDSSDDSDVESTEQCLANSKQTSLHQQATKEIQDAAGTSRDKKEFSLEPPSRPLVLKEFDTAFSFDCEVAPNDVVSEVGIFYRIVKCFQELQDAICRLQKKNLFPYNPTALLKLLKYIEVISNKTMNTL
ncbi:protein Lines homolog 1 isoform X2 [Homo sapiens]|uniref:protein Lines homolog 1 isoform X2 n=1 Tax=Homo sapiens TaxID=9606 RepID=UPI000387B94D|nr:protein Lines homolog 1 isoform X2 [Homo sapiens]XP_047288740.1 protein Lines homolog 1 isoform X2 [Homo sapiens]XP_047288741.1 protein Lines homolog 1 isoform X2 [Homo sapiens]|eukprot:XP_005255000.1 protein Lines homolog 1 isoform X2 [Homo sapiens]